MIAPRKEISNLVTVFLCAQLFEKGTSVLDLNRPHWYLQWNTQANIAIYLYYTYKQTSICTTFKILCWTVLKRTFMACANP